MRIRRVLQEFEARFHPTLPSSKVRGKSEWKHYGDGTYRFKISIRDFALPEESKVDLCLDGQWIMRLDVEKGRVKVDLENDSGSGIPTVKAGGVLQIKSGQDVLAEGKYESE